MKLTRVQSTGAVRASPLAHQSMEKRAEAIRDGNLSVMQNEVMSSMILYRDGVVMVGGVAYCAHPTPAFHESEMHLVSYQVRHRAPLYGWNQSWESDEAGTETGSSRPQWTGWVGPSSMLRGLLNGRKRPTFLSL